jgi:hypothetical protein
MVREGPALHTRYIIHSHPSSGNGGVVIDAIAAAIAAIAAIAAAAF